MKVAIVSESPADEAAARILVEGFLGRQTQSVLLSSPRPPGISGVLRILSPALKQLYYHTDAEALVVVVDSDHAPVHQEVYEQPGGADKHYRLCLLRQAVAQAQGRLHLRSGRPPIKIALGVAVPAVEAWYQCGIDPHVTEAAWIVALQSRSYPYTKKSLKQAVYGMDRPPLTLETRRATEEAQRLAQNLTLLERLFPAGFGPLIQGIRSW